MWKTTVGQRFDKKASSYDQYALVQKEMAWHLHNLALEAKGDTTSIERLLEIGCGTGGLTRLMRKSFPCADYRALDLAQGMIDLARTRITADGMACEFIHADVEEWVWQQEESSADLIISGACFQWLSRPAETLQGLFRLLRPASSLLFSTFGPRTFTELHDSFAHAHVALGQEEIRHGLTFHSADQWKSMLSNAGFTSVTVETEQVVPTYPDVLSFLQAVKAVGANSSQAQARGLGSRKLLAEMMRYYENTYGCGQGIPVTYDLMYICGRRSRNLSK